MKINLFVICRFLETSINIIKEHHHICFFQHQGKFIVLHFTKFQQLINQTKHPIRTFIHQLYGINHLFGNLIQALYFFQSSLNHCQRSTEFM